MQPVASSARSAKDNSKPGSRASRSDGGDGDDEAEADDKDEDDEKADEGDAGDDEKEAGNASCCGGGNRTCNVSLGRAAKRKRSTEVPMQKRKCRCDRKCRRGQTQNSRRNRKHTRCHATSCGDSARAHDQSDCDDADDVDVDVDDCDWFAEEEEATLGCSS